MKIIARIQSDFPDKFGIPRQSGVVSGLKAQVIFEPTYRDINALRGLEEYSHIWLLWEFSESKRETWSPTVRPPRLGGNKQVGVFATRSPFRPNPLGLSCVKLDGIEIHATLGPVLHLSGADLMHGTPIYDIKPYLPYADCHPEAISPFIEDHSDALLTVEADAQILAQFPEQQRETLLDLLAHDPRPAYIRDPHREYGLSFANHNIRFTVDGKVLRLQSISRIEED